MLIPAKDKNEIEEVKTLPGIYRNLIVKNDDHAQSVADDLSAIKSRHKELEDRRKAITKPLDDAKKSAMDLFRPATEALRECETIIKNAIGRYTQEKQADLRKAEAEAAEKLRKEQERAALKAEKLREQGKVEKADAVEYEAATKVVSLPVEPPKKIVGASVQKKWTAEVTSVIDVCRLIADGILPPTLVDFKKTELNKIASTWTDTKEFSGLKITHSFNVSSR